MLLVNYHPMITRAKVDRSKLKALIVHLENTTTKQVLSQNEWCNVMQSGYKSLLKNETWTLAPLPPHI